MTDLPKNIILEKDSHSKNALRAWLQIIKCSKTIEQLINSHFDSEYHSSLSRFDVLANLDLEGKQAVSTTELAKKLIASKGNISRLLDRMEDDNLIARQANSKDRRITEVFLTDKGRNLFSVMANDHEGWVGDIFSDLSNNEIKTMLDIFQKLRSRIDDIY